MNIRETEYWERTLKLLENCLYKRYEGASKNSVEWEKDFDGYCSVHILRVRNQMTVTFRSKLGVKSLGARDAGDYWMNCRDAHEHMTMIKGELHERFWTVTK